ncbi:MAG: hypothetical protein LBJ43_00580 [Propionibacteriaceae bacterium]|nr:hypothetical protein [Propionibacteriaceae bacterium]
MTEITLTLNSETLTANLADRFSLQYPEPVTINVVPAGANGNLDLSRAYTGGEPRYGTRQLSAACWIEGNTPYSISALHTAQSQVARWHGRRVALRLSSVPGYHLDAEVAFRNWTIDDAVNVADFNLDAICQPFWIADTPTEIQIAPSTPSTAATLTNLGDVTVTLEYKSTAAVTIVATQGSYPAAAAADWTRFSGLVLPPGNLAVNAIGSGTLKFRWRVLSLGGAPDVA